MSPSGGTPQSALSARLGAVATAFLVLVLVLVGCSGTDSADVSLRDLSCTISRQAVALNEALDSVTFAGGCPQPVEVKTVYRKNVGHKGVILPARCSFRLPAPIAGPGRLSARIGFHPGDWGLGKVGLPTVTFAIEHGEVERELVRVDFSDPELADDPRWLRRSVEFPATDGEEITLVVRIEPEADRGGPQAHVYIANLLLHSLESISLSLDQEAKIVRVPRGFREQVPDGEDAHGPYRPSPPFDRLFDGVPYSQQDNVWNRRVTTPFLKNDTFKLLADERPRHAAVARLKTLYDGELRYADHHLSRFLDRMTELRLFDETAIVVTSDHGEEFFEHGFTYHNNILHEEKIRIPLILKPHRGYPVRGPKRVEGPVDGVLNLFPTVLELVGLPAPEGLHGTSLMPRVDASAPEGTSILFHDNEWFRAVRSGPWKFVTTTLSQEKADKIPEFKIMGGYEDMLFHLESDPRERVNLIDREPQVAQRLRELLERKFTEITRRREQAVSGWEANQRELDEKTQERLRALGYLD